MVDKGKVFRGDFKSVYSMGQYDFERFHKILLRLDEFSIELNSGNYEIISAYYSTLRTLYRSWKPLIHDSRKEGDDVWSRSDFEVAFRQVKPEVDRIRKNLFSQAKFSFKQETLEVLDEIHTQLMIIKQLIGLGIEVKKEFTPNQKLKKAFNS